MVKEVSVHASLRAKLVGGGNIKKGETEIHRTQFNNVHIWLEFYAIEKVSAMKIPKERRTYCPKCKKQTVHSISIYKKGKERTSALGARTKVPRIGKNCEDHKEADAQIEVQRMRL